MSSLRSSESETARTHASAGVESVPVRANDDDRTRIRRSEEPDPRELPPWARELIGAQLDHFELLDCIGEGGMGRVFRARDARLDRLVALKVLNPEFANDADMRRRFEQEAKAASRLDSPFFARVYHFGADKGVCFIAMELVEGRTLRQVIEENDRLDPAAALRIGAALAYGLHHASLRGVVHRDVKPSNVVVDDDGNVKLIDMGLARDFMQASGDATKTNVTLGTLDYISPEQASDPRLVDVRSDIYSLGCTLYHALTGRPPFPEGTDLQKLLSHHSETAPNPRDLVPDVPVEIADLVVAMMAKRASDRPQSPADLIRRMQETADLLQMAMPTSAPALPPAQTTPWWQQQLSWWGPAILFLAAASIYAMIPGERASELNWERPPAAAGVASSEFKDRQTKVEPPKRSTVGPVVVVAENADLAKFVKEAQEGAVLQLAGDEYALAAAAEGSAARGLLIEKNLTIEPLSNQGRVRLRFQPTTVAAVPTKDALSLVQVRSARLTLSRIWIEPGVRDRPSVGVRVDQGELELRDCLFDRGVDLMTPNPAGSFAVLVNGGGATALGTRFVSGDGAIKTVGGPATLSLWNTLVGPYRRAFTFDAAKTEAHVKHSAVMASGEAVFTLNSPSGASLIVESTIFAVQPSIPPGILVDSPKNNPMPSSLWKGAGNLYAGGFARQITSNGRTLVEDVEKMQGWGFVEVGAQRINEWPWSTPWDSLASTVDVDERWRPLVALRDGVGVPGSDGLPVGIDPGATAPVVAEEPNAKNRIPQAKSDEVAKKAGGWIVDPSQEPNESAGIFASLEAAVRRAPDGKTTSILLRGNAEFGARQIKIVGKTIALRTGADRQKLRLAEPKDMEIGPSTMFDVGEGGRLQFDGAHLDVFAGRSDAPGAAVARCTGGGIVEVANSTVRVSQGQGVQAMVFFRPTNVGGQEGAAPPTLRIRRSDIRGAGTLLASDPRQAWSLDAAESKLGFEGSLLRLSGASGRAGEPTANAAKFRQCVALLGAGLLLIEPSTDAFGNPSATPVQFDAAASVFAAVGTGSAPLLDVAAPVGSRMGVEWNNAIKWQGDWNAIAGFGSLMRIPEVDRTAGMATTTLRTFGYSDWLNYFRLAPTKHHHQSAKAPAVQTIWDLNIPHGRQWLEQFTSLPDAFADESNFKGLP
jgi:serine/threonine protein kinase